MLVELFVCACGTALAVIGSQTFWPVHNWWDFYIPIVLFIAGYLEGLFGIVWNVVDIIGRFLMLRKKPREKPSRVARFTMCHSLKYIFNHALISYKIRGLNKIPKKEKFLLVSNHRSSFDSLLMSVSMKKYDIAFITKQSNLKIPLGKRLILNMGYVAIDRSDKLDSLEGMRIAAQEVKDGYCSMGVFPEGTRQVEKLLGDFHEGVFNIALKAKVPIVVMTSWGTDRIKKNFPFKITKVRQDVVCTIPYDEIEGKTSKEVSDMVRDIMGEHLRYLAKRY